MIATLCQLFASYLKIGFFGFGGGYAMLSLIQNEVVVQHAWLSEAQFADIVAVSQMTPGPIAINSATYVGDRRIGGGDAGRMPARADDNDAHNAFLHAPARQPLRKGHSRRHAAGRDRHDRRSGAAVDIPLVGRRAQLHRCLELDTIRADALGIAAQGQSHTVDIALGRGRYIDLRSILILICRDPTDNAPPHRRPSRRPVRPRLCRRHIPHPRPRGTDRRSRHASASRDRGEYAPA